MRVEEVIKACNGELIAGDMNTSIKRFCTDTRKIEKDDFFVALSGENFDGHDYIMQAFLKGAMGCISSKEIKNPGDKIVIKTADTKKAFLDISGMYRDKFNIPFIAVTGSIGKTTIKELIYSILNEKGKILKSIGNYNNEIGVPKTLFKLDKSYEMAVIEMGMNSFGEIEKLSNIVKPEIAVISNIGISHIGNFKSITDILNAKMEIISGLKDEGTLILNGDDELLYGLKNDLSCKVIYFGTFLRNDIRAYDIILEGENGSSFSIKYKDKEMKFHISIIGRHNIMNALAAITVALLMDIEPLKIIAGISKYKSTEMRLDISSKNNIKIINDVYNSGPDSMKAAIDVLTEIANARRKVVILGDMLELGEYSKKAHIEVGEYFFDNKVDLILLSGKYAKHIENGLLEKGNNKIKVYIYKSNDELISNLSSLISYGDIILVKGSRGSKMEEVVEELKKI